MKCSKCGNEFEGKFCPECGTPADIAPDGKNSQANPQPQQAQQPIYQSPNQSVDAKPKKKKGCVTWGIIVLIAIIVIIAIGQSCNSGNNRTATLVTSGQLSSGTVSKSTAGETQKTSFKVGETAKYNDVELTAAKVEKSKGSEYDSPKSGNEFVIVTVKYKNDGKENISYNPYDFKMKNSKGQIISQSFTTVNQKDALNSGDLAPGGEIEGTIAFEEPKGDKGLVLQYTGNIFNSNSEVDFQLQ